MRTLQLFATAAGMMSLLSSHAQAPEVSAGTEDFSGIYWGSLPVHGPEVYPFTPEGERVQGAFDPLVEDPRQVDDCASESMPAVLWAGTVNNMRFTQHGDTITIYYEHGGTVRSIHMDGMPPPSDEPHSELGYSAGRWSGGELTIETTHLTDAFIFVSLGYPISRQARVTERYWREDGLNLRTQVVVDDPVNYTEPIEYSREWIWSPEEEVLDWDCVSLGPRDAEPDIDELRRLLRDL